MTHPIKTIEVKPRVPERLEPLYALSGNLYFAWHHGASELFRRIHPDLWKASDKNPAAFLGRLQQEELESLVADEGFLAHMERVNAEFNRYLAEKPDEDIFSGAGGPFVVAYFTAECGPAECLPIYSGGLGILSGDHLKSASDLNLPIVGVSLAYQKGYFRQYLTHDGWQMETYPVNDFCTLPMERVTNAQGEPLTVSVDLRGETVQIQVWRVRVGRTVLYLLDTNVEGNSPAAREVTSELYGGDREMRIRQEIVLGIGGVRVLEALGLEPAVYHMNEGHSAFALFERIRHLHQDMGFSFNEAVEFVKATSVFTTHTPVPAGNDMFHPDLVRAYFEGFAVAMGINIDVLLGFGRQNPRAQTEEFCMTVLALRLSSRCNGVSRLHSQVSRRMWHQIWPKMPERDLPIGYITNGVHIPSWISREMAENYARYLGPRWIEDPDNVMVWERVEKIPDTELWRTHERAKERLVAFARARLREQMFRRGVPRRELALADDVLNAEALTIGFARRFAPYKRASLILRDIPRLERILLDARQPVQLIFAGKAHPQDHMGKELIKQIVQIGSQEKFRRHVVFLEDYDIEVARHLVQGVDVWLNTPRRPLEACGTSGMKAVANGALHLSVLDGWWDEGYDPDLGWAIGGGEDFEDHEYQDELESRILYDILEKDVVPLFYDRGADHLPRGWVAMMKASLHRLCPMFNTHRMVIEYWEQFYLPCARRGSELKVQDWQGLQSLAAWREKIMFNWGDVAVREVMLERGTQALVRQPCKVQAVVKTGSLAPVDLVVEAYFGRLDPAGAFTESHTAALTHVDALEEGVHRFQGDVVFKSVGHYGLNVRVTPRHPDAASRLSMGLVAWGE